MNTTNMIKYVLFIPPVNIYLISLVGSSLGSLAGSIMKKTLIYTARTAYSAIVNKKC